MDRNKVKKIVALAVVISLLSIFAYWAIEGAIEQWPRSDTFGQKLETVIQFFFGILSLMTITTLFWVKQISSFIRYLWILSFVMTAGLSSLVWGPPMLLISLAFAGFSLLLAFGILWIIRKIEHTSSIQIISQDE